MFPDVRPAAPHHYLVLTREHIIDAKHLTKEHIPMRKTTASFMFAHKAWEPGCISYMTLLMVVLGFKNGDCMFTM